MSLSGMDCEIQSIINVLNFSAFCQDKHVYLDCIYILVLRVLLCLFLCFIFSCFSMALCINIGFYLKFQFGLFRGFEFVWYLKF